MMLGPGIMARSSAWKGTPRWYPQPLFSPENVPVCGRGSRTRQLVHTLHEIFSVSRTPNRFGNRVTFIGKQSKSIGTHRKAQHV